MQRRKYFFRRFRQYLLLFLLPVTVVILISFLISVSQLSGSQERAGRDLVDAVNTDVEMSLNNISQQNVQFANNPYMLIQFLRGIPRDLDESAYIDGCSTWTTMTKVILPLMKPALFSAGLFQFLWTYNDYFNSLIFINSVKKYPISLAVRLSLDSESVVQWGKVMAMAFVAVVPLMALFFAAQKYFVEGIATSGMKN